MRPDRVRQSIPLLLVVAVMVLGAGARTAGWNVPAFAQMLGLLAGLGVIGCVYRFAVHLLGLSRWGAAAACLVVACSGPVATWSVSGMETVPSIRLGLRSARRFTFLERRRSPTDWGHNGLHGRDDPTAWEPMDCFQRMGIVQMLSSGHRGPCQLVWQVNRLVSQERQHKQRRLVQASSGLWAVSRTLPASGLSGLAASWLLSSWLLPDKLAGGQTPTSERDQSVVFPIRWTC